MPGKTVRIAILAFLACLARGADAQDSPQQPQPAQAASSQASPQNVPSGQLHGAVRISLDEAIQMALEHNHTLLAARTTIQQN